MSWEVEDAKAKQLLLEASTCRYIDSCRIDAALTCISFDDVNTFSDQFFALMQRLSKWSGDYQAHYIVLKPDPIWYFHRHFSKYPIFYFDVKDSSDGYFSLLGEDPGGSPADAVGINCYEWVILPTSHRWFVHCMRDPGDKGGHLWIPESLVQDTVKDFPWLAYPALAETVAFNKNGSWVSS